jgi:hypothetical protein
LFLSAGSPALSLLCSSSVFVHFVSGKGQDKQRRFASACANYCYPLQFLFTARQVGFQRRKYLDNSARRQLYLPQGFMAHLDASRGRA